MNLDLKGKYALVTGGSAGIGLAVAATLFREGAEVYICARRVRGLIAAAKGIGEIGAFRCDVTKRGDLDRMFRRIRRLDILVNNAGGMDHYGGFTYTDVRTWRRTFEWNLFSAVEVTRRALPLLRKSKGAIVNIASEVGKQPFLMAPDYCASKAAMLSFSKSLANELAPEGIRVNAVCPGPVLTDSWRSESKSVAHLKKLVSRAVKERVPLGRIGEPSDVAGIVAFLCSPRAGWLTGGAISVDGGAVKSIT